MRKSLVAVVVMGSALFLAPQVVNADFGGICGKRECTVGPDPNPHPSDNADTFILPEPQQLLFAYLGSARQAMRDGQWDSAEGWASKALQQQPDNAEAKAIISQIRAARERRAATALNNEGVALSARGDVDGAVQAYARALALDPGDPIIRKNLEFAQTRVQLRSMRGKAQSMAARERLEAQAAAADAQQRADNKARDGLETLSDKIAGLAWAGCVGLACRQAAVGDVAGDAAVGTESREGASSIARTPFDDRGGSIVVVPEGQSKPVFDRGRALDGGEATALRTHIAKLYDEDIKLEAQIKVEGDKVRRDSLIQRQAFVRSKRQVEQIKLATFAARFAPDDAANDKGKSK